jgi:rhomboid-like protein
VDAVARERQHWLSRGFATTPWVLANKLGKQRKEAPRSSIPPKTTARKPPSPSSPLSAAKQPSASAPKKAEKATVQLSQAQVTTILGSGLTFDQGMDLLQEIQYRRVTGSLSDKGLAFPERAEFSTQHASRALDWLRENYPVDEEAAAYEYAEELAATERKELEERARRLKIYKRDDKDKKNEEQEQEEDIYIDESYDKTPLRPDQTRDITSGSALTARKEYVEASRKQAAIDAEKIAEEYEARGEKPPEPYRGHDLVVAKKTALEETRQQKHERWEKLAEDAMLKQEDINADRSAFSRLWAPVSFGLAVVGGAWLYADSYEPPKSSMRVFPSISPAVATVAAMVGVNLVILIMWRNPNAWKFMNRYLLLSPGAPKAFSVLGALFSHQQFSHLAWNMGGLYLVGCAGEFRSITFQTQHSAYL